MKTEKRSWKQMHDDLWKQMHDKLLTACDIMARGYRICEVNGQKDILIVGINPSYPEKQEPPTYLLTDTKNDDKNSYWKNVASMLKDSSNDLYNKAAYIDVFSCRESNQLTVEDEIIRNPYLFPYVQAQVEATQTIIETIIQPKVIIIKNKLARVFFGKDSEFTWMGYEFENIDNEENIDNHKKYEVCRIKGFSNRKDRINPDLKDTNLKGCIVCLTRASSYLNESEWEDYYPDPQTINHWKEMVINKH